VSASWLDADVFYAVSRYAGQSLAEYDAQRVKTTANAAATTGEADKLAEQRVEDFMMYLACMCLFIKGLLSLLSLT
jgi:hypothetical protein